MQRSRGVETSEWTEIEEKVPDQVGSHPTNRSITVTATGKKGKGKKMKLHIPQSMIPELKRAVAAAFWDQETLDNPANTASLFSFFGQISQGTTALTRLGDSIFVKKVVLRLYLEQSSSQTFETVSLAVLLDNEPAAGTPAWTDVFQGIGGASTSAYSVAVPNYDKRFRFQFLKRMTIPLHFRASYWNGSSAVATSDTGVVVMEIPINRRVEYDSSSSVYKGCELRLFGWSEVASNTPKCTASYQIFFEDS